MHGGQTQGLVRFRFVAVLVQARLAQQVRIIRVYCTNNCGNIDGWWPVTTSTASRE